MPRSVARAGTWKAALGGGMESRSFDGIDKRKTSAVVVNTYGDKRRQLVETTITSLRRTVDWDTTRLIVVDTAGSNEKRRFLAPFCDVLECVEDPSFGEGAGWNLGVKRALSLGAKHVAMVNDDIFFHNFGWFDECRDKLERHPEVAVMTPYGHARDGALIHPLDHGDPVYGHHNVGRLRDDVFIRNRVPFQVWVFDEATYREFGPFREVTHAEQRGWVSDVCPDSTVQNAIKENGRLLGATDVPAAEHTGYGPGVSYWQHQPSRFDDTQPTEAFRRMHESLHGDAAEDDSHGTIRIYQLELTNRCPFTCVMCPRGEMERPLGDMDPGLFRSLIDQVGDNQGEPLYLHHFGESLMHAQFGELVRYATDHGVRTHLSCNPNVLTKSKTDEVLSSGMTSILFSVDGITNETFRAIRGRAAEIDAAEANLRWFLEQRIATQNPIDVTIQMIDMRANAHEHDGFLERFAPLEAMGARLHIKAFDTFNDPKKKVMSTRFLTGRCTLPFDHLVVLWDGRVVPCCHDEDGHIVLGDATRESLAEIWRGPAYRRFRAGFLEHPHCRNCSWR